MDSIEDIQTMTAFRDHAAELLAHIKSNKRPMVLTVDGEAAVVMQDPEAYQRLVDLATGFSALEGIRQGREDLKASRIRSAHEVFDQRRTEYGFAR